MKFAIADAQIKRMMTELSEEYIKDLSCIANAIGYELYKDKSGIKSTTDKEGIKQIWLEEEVVSQIRETAFRVMKEMIILGWSKANFSNCGCFSNPECGCNGCNCGSA